MNRGGWPPPQQVSALKSDSWAVKAKSRKLQLAAPDHQMKALNVAEKVAFKNETEHLPNLSAPGKENRCLFLVELKIEDQ